MNGDGQTSWANVCAHAGEELWPLEPESAERCPRVHINATDTPSLREVLVGPITTRAGTWATVWLPFTLVRRGDRVVEFVGDAVSMLDGRTIPYPPLHLHHIHVSLQQPGANAKVHWFETHGDYSRGEVTDYRTRLPDGYCVEHPAGAELLVQAQVNDVRFRQEAAMSISPWSRVGAKAEVGAAPLVWALRIRFRLAPPPDVARGVHACRAASKLLLWHPLNHSSYGEHLWRYDVDNARSVWWWHLESPLDGQLLPPGWLHSHRARYAGIVLLDGAVDPFALSGLAAADCAASPPPSIARPNCSLPAVREAIVNGATRRVLCVDDPNVPTSLRVPWQPGSGLGGSYDRAGALNCRASRLRKGGALTVIAFSEARWGKEIERFPQHTMLFLYLRTAVDASRMEDVHPRRGYSRWRLDEGRVELLDAFYPPERGGGA